MNFKQIEYIDFNSEKRKIYIQPKKYNKNERSVLYVALKFDPVLSCYKYLGSELAEKGIESKVLLLADYTDTTDYAEIHENPDYLKKLKEYFDNEAASKPLLCFYELVKNTD
jgi:hypothetical protein